MKSTSSTYIDYAFLGLGCGNSLMLLQLAEEGLLSGKHILVIEPDSTGTNNRTFCFWMDPERVRSSFLFGLVEHQWSKVLAGDTVQELEPLRYYRISGKGLTDQARLLLSHEQVYNMETRYEEEPTFEGDFAQLSIGGASFHARYVFDNRPPKYAQPHVSESRLFQSFYGWEIASEAAVFDPTCFTMMDFNVQQDGATQFMYVLPFDAHRALVEITRFGEANILSELATEALKTYLAERSISYEIETREQGVIPMFCNDISVNKSSRTWINTGERAGMLKPSTGYSFERSLSYAYQVVHEIKGQALLEPPKKNRFSYYDRLLLQLLRDKPGKGSLIFTQLFKRNSASTVFKFLDERSSIAEDLRILQSLPFGLFIRAALKDAVWRSPRLLSPLFIATTVLLLLQSLGVMPIGYWILAIGFLILGIPHGALDHLHALRKPWGWNMPGYVLVYLTLGVLILGLFCISPWIGLLCFLGYSMWHFGEADLAHWNLGKSWKSLLWGCYVLGGILVSHAPETVQILREMKVFIPWGSVPSASMAYVWILLGGVFFMGWLRKGAIASSVVSLLLLCALPLIPAFALFFIFQHSLHGWKKIKEMSLKSDLQLWINALPFTLGAVVLFGLNTYYASFTWGQVFIFLAALSFPHVVLMAILYRKSSIGA